MGLFLHTGLDGVGYVAVINLEDGAGVLLVSTRTETTCVLCGESRGKDCLVTRSTLADMSAQSFH